jgi:predicted S18 family serine protease
VGLLEAVEAEVRLWVHEVLSVPDGYFAGMAPCPYARSAVLKNLVTVEVVDSHERSAEHKLKFDPASEAVTVILVQSLDHLTQASDQLSKTEYYTNFSDADLSYISARKEQANDGYA